MPFGWRNASQTFQKYINIALSGLDFVFPYIDDVLVASRNQKEHEKHSRIVFERLAKHNLRLNLKLCVLATKEVVFFTNLISADGYCPTPEKVQAILDYPQH